MTGIVLDVRFIQRKGTWTLAIRASEKISPDLKVLHSYTLQFHFSLRPTKCTFCILKVTEKFRSFQKIIQ